MRLSEAIRLGAAMKPQAFGEMHQFGGTCARGSALDAIGLLDVTATPEAQLYAWFDTEWAKWSIKKPASCPVSGVLTYCLNDTHHWTRERIADWVELHEPLPQVESVNDATCVAKTEEQHV